MNTTSTHTSGVDFFLGGGFGYNTGQFYVFNSNKLAFKLKGFYQNFKGIISNMTIEY